MLELAHVAGLAIACVKTVLEHGGFDVVPPVLFFLWQTLCLFVQLVCLDLYVKKIKRHRCLPRIE